jgi:site-specific DNA-methyltransferase (adenine-specific)
MTRANESKRPKVGRYSLHHDDAFQWLKARAANSIHACVTDPPFGLVEYRADELRKRSKKNGGGGIWRLPQGYDGYKRRPMPRFTVLDHRHHQAIAKFHRELSRLLHRVLVPGGHVIIASQPLLSHLVIRAFLNAGFELRGQVARTVMTLRGGDRPKFAHKKYSELSVVPRSSWEPWLIFRKPCEGLVKDNLRTWGTGALRRPEKDVPFKDLLVSSPARNGEREIADHPSLKPQGFMRQIVRASLPLGTGTILDPFMGSGSTIAAARACGLRSIGIEVNRKYFGMAVRAVPKLALYEVSNSTNGHGKNGAALGTRKK